MTDTPTLGRPSTFDEPMERVTIYVPCSLVDAWRKHPRGISFAAREALEITEKESEE